MTPEEFATFIAENKKHNWQEAKVVHKVWKALKKGGRPITEVWDSVETTKVSTEKELDDIVFNLDEAWLLTDDGAWVRIVMGNDWDCLVDYTVSLEELLQPVNDYIQTKW